MALDLWVASDVLPRWFITDAMAQSWSLEKERALQALMPRKFWLRSKILLGQWAMGASVSMWLSLWVQMIPLDRKVPANDLVGKSVLQECQVRVFHKSAK